MRSIETLIQTLYVRLFSQLSTRAHKQRGASALEYIVLAAVLVAALIAVGVWLSNGNGFQGFFSDLFGKADSALNS